MKAYESFRIRLIVPAPVQWSKGRQSMTDSIINRAEFEEAVSGLVGKFVMEPPHTAYYWDRMMDGDGCEVYSGGCPDPECPYGDECELSSDLIYTSFEVSAEERAAFPELDGAAEVRIWTDGNGFVYCDLIETLGG